MQKQQKMFAKENFSAYFSGMEENSSTLPIVEETIEYNEDNIRHLDDMEHIRVRSGMYIGRLGDGSPARDRHHVRALQ